MRILLLLSIICVFASCNPEGFKEEIILESTEKDFGEAPPPLLGNIFVGIVNEGSCGSTLKYNYSMYAAATETHTQDREVQAIVVKSGAFIDARVVTIPAGQLVSNNVPVFKYARKSYGSVISKVYNVLVDGQIIDGYGFPTSHSNVKNCYITGSGGDCTTGIYNEDDPNTAENEGPGDQDNDGVCNYLDLDDNGNDIPDEWE